MSIYVLCSIFGFLISPIFLQGQELNLKSQTLLQLIKEQKNTVDIESYFSNITTDQLVQELKTDDEKLAFWINIYNAYIQILLIENPELYEDKNAFFTEPRVSFAGKILSFDEIEHGIIRHSQFKFGLGYITNPFASDWEKSLRVEKRDGRIHFALNCGAKSCPYIAIYKPKEVRSQLQKSTCKYLSTVSEMKEEEDTVVTSPLFKWFRGDFGKSEDIRDLLQSCEILEQEDQKTKMIVGPYDWTLELGNFIDL